MEPGWFNHILSIDNHSFGDAALELFRYQARENGVYRAYLDALHIQPETIHDFRSIPFLPISFFKSQEVKTGSFNPVLVFESSGTMGSHTSRHFVADPELYKLSFTHGFERVYGSPSDYCIIGLLPSYLERQHSSLVYMVDQLIRLSSHTDSGFYLHETAQLARKLEKLEQSGQKTILIGVTYALLDFAIQFPMKLQHTILMETGGMKGRRKEMIREEVHQELKDAFGLSAIHSEYGMTELLSQAYSTADGVFRCPPWMRVLMRDEEDPLSIRQEGAGIINVIDLANIDSCAFIATEDAGKPAPDGGFEVLGRVDGSDLRGCSLLIV